MARCLRKRGAMRGMWVIVLAGCSSGHGSLGGGENWNGSYSGGGSGGGGGSTNTNPSGGGGFDAGGGPGPMGGSDASQPAPMMDAAPTTCAAPADCAMGQICCGKLNLAPLNMTCDIQSFDKTCQASCPTMVSFQCAAQQVQICTASTDCKDAKFPNCCTFTYDMKQATFCVENVFKLAADACN